MPSARRIVPTAKPVGFLPAQLNKSIRFVSNAANDHEYGRIATLPTNFGSGEFMVSMDLKLTTGTASDFADGTSQQRSDWTTRNTAKYASGTWWFRGNFCMDGHQNAGSAYQNGTLSLQFTNTGRTRWTFGDGAAAGARSGALHATQDGAEASLRDGNWHRVAFVRRFINVSDSQLEAWQDGVLIATETSTSRTNMWSSYWQTWAGYPSGQEGWFFGGEKQACVGVASQWEDYKGLLSQLALVARAPSSLEMADWQTAIPNSYSGLAEIWRFNEQTGSTATGLNGGTMSLNAGAGGQPLAWDADGPN